MVSLCNTPFTSYTIDFDFFRGVKSRFKNSLCETPKTIASYLLSGKTLDVDNLYSCFTSSGLAQGS